MSAYSEFSLSLYELFAVIGLVQAVSVIVYIVFRAGHIRHVVVPVLCFLWLAVGFLIDFGHSRLAAEFDFYAVIQQLVWLSLPAFSVLLIVQISYLGAFPQMVYWGNLVFPLGFMIIGWGCGAVLSESPCGIFSLCGYELKIQSVTIAGVIGGVLGLLILWSGRSVFDLLRDARESKNERFWLIVSFIVVNLLFIFVTLLWVSASLGDADYLLARNILGVGMAYLASTSLFRIYPPSITLNKNSSDFALSDEEAVLVKKLQELMEIDKVYQEQNFSRNDLSRELGVSEARVSRIVSACYQKSLPQVINERRVRDSLQLLEQTDAHISVIAGQVGFNSVPTYNRVFKDIFGVSPSEYRSEQKTE